MLALDSCYSSPDTSLWTGRSDTAPLQRHFQWVELLDLNEQALPQNPSDRWALIGFCSDEGIRRNLGRPGSKEGPDSLRRQLAKLPFHDSARLVDLGNIHCLEHDLELAQSKLADLVGYAQSLNYNTLLFGGGHDIAWGHYQGLAKRYHDQRIGVINFDAHFDLRTPKQPQHGSSGTPFLQIAKARLDAGLNFDYHCLGIQKTANTRDLFDKAEELGVSYMSAEEIHHNSLAWQMTSIEDFLSQQDHIYLSLCLDVFADSFAPGVSATQALGITPWQALPLLKYVVQSGKVIGIDIAELSPPYDKNEKTARLAANIVAELLYLHV